MSNRDYCKYCGENDELFTEDGICFNCWKKEHHVGYGVCPNCGELEELYDVDGEAMCIDCVLDNNVLEEYDADYDWNKQAYEDRLESEAVEEMFRGE